MMNSISVKRIEPVPGNTFTADWTSTREDRRIGNWVPDTCSNRPSSVAEYDIAITFEETTALLNGYLDILNNMLEERLKIDLRRYNIVSFNKGKV
tara:strand:- start:85 stop:369 length:285 start_codon:yes stop_codon:yes gene_type:complete